MSKKPEPAWEIARLYPDQGAWDEGEYLSVTADTNWLVEFTDGYIEVLGMPKLSHQRMVAFLYGLLLAFVSERALGELLFAPLRVRLRKGMIREPDLAFMLQSNSHRKHEDAWDGADLVVEVVSDDAQSRERDLVKKREEYARGGVPEYWIVDPVEKKVTVLKLAGSKYAVAGEYRAGERAASVLLEGFEVEVGKVWDAGKV